MPKKKRQSRVEIATKLAQANDLATQGKLQSEIARSLGVSIMTLHRWRKEASQPDRAPSGGTRLAELQLENSRLRRLVTDLLLEKNKLEEAAQRQKVSALGAETETPELADRELARRYDLVREELAETIHLNETLGACRRAPWGSCSP